MYIRSTGLGSTLLAAEVSKVESSNVIPTTLEPSTDGKEPKRLLVTMETIDPVNWTVRIFIEPPDLRRLFWLVLLHPSLLFSGLGLLFGRAKKSEQDN